MRLLRQAAKDLSIIVALMLASASPASARLIDGVAATEPDDVPSAVRATLFRASRGDSDAQYELGLSYYEGRGVAKDLFEAATWWRRAAEQGDTKAQYNLGVLLYSGKGIRKDVASAMRWWRKAAEQGHIEAQYNLGLVYSSGRGVPVDQREAAKWYRMAAIRGGQKAQYNLGVLYAKGGAIPVDYVQAHAWFSLVATDSPPGELREKAEYNRDVLASKLTPDQLSDAQRLARELMAEEN